MGYIYFILQLTFGLTNGLIYSLRNECILAHLFRIQLSSSLKLVPLNSNTRCSKERERKKRNTYPQFIIVSHFYNFIFILQIWIFFPYMYCTCMYHVYMKRRIQIESKLKNCETKKKEWDKLKSVSILPQIYTNSILYVKNKKDSGLSFISILFNLAITRAFFQLVSNYLFPIEQIRLFLTLCDNKLSFFFYGSSTVFFRQFAMIN